MISFKKGRAIAKINGGKLDNELLYINNEEIHDDSSGFCDCRNCSPKRCKKRPCCDYCCFNDDLPSDSKHIFINDGILSPIPKVEERGVDYIAGPSGSGKSTYAATLASVFKKVYPKSNFYIFSRTDCRDDPAFKHLNPIQVTIDDSIVDDPIDAVSELKGGCMVLFDDCNTIPNDKQRKAVDKLMADIMEVGRKLNIWIIITNHLVIPNEKKMARTVMNEMQSMTVFPKSGSVQQIKYCLKQYYGLNNKQIDMIVSLPSRWVTVFKNYPMCVMHERGAFIL